MTQISLFSGSAASSSRSAAHHHAHRAPAALLGFVSGLVIAFLDWRERYQSRRDLMRLTDYQLKDIGLSRFDAEEEYRKPFWRG